MPVEVNKANIVLIFEGTYAFLSNFYASQFQWQGEMWRTSEHAYQAAKTLHPEERQQIVESGYAGAAKRLGQSVTIRDDWDEIKVAVMLDILRAKFSQSKTLRDKLLETGDMWLVEGNTWGDEFWGKSMQKNQGDNWLGRLLMVVRSELKWGNEFVRE